MLIIAIKCSGKKCKEVFHIYDQKVEGGLNDQYMVTFKCKKCGSMTKCILHNIDHLFQTDSYELVEKREIYIEDEISSIIAECGEIAIVVGYEHVNEPIHCWTLYDTPFWQNKEYDFEFYATKNLFSVMDVINGKWYSYFNAYMAGQHFAPKVKRIFVCQNYKIEDDEYTALWVSDFKEKWKLSVEDFYLIHHSDSEPIDGIYSRDCLLKYLERLLVRWRALANEVVVATPFIGYDFPFSKDSDKEDLIKLWSLLNGLLEMKKTLFFTRPATYSSLKKDQKQIEIPTDVLKEWNLMSNLQKVVDSTKTRAKMKEKFHLKIYAGVFDNHVELFSGSYNVQTNSTMENMCLRNLSREHFNTHYMNAMMDDFEYKESEEDDVLLITVGLSCKANCGIKTMSEVNSLILS